MGLRCCRSSTASTAASRKPAAWPARSPKPVASGCPTRAAPPLKLSDDVGRAVYQLAARAPIGPADRYRLLAAPTIEARVELLGAALDDTDAMLRFRLA